MLRYRFNLYVNQQTLPIKEILNWFNYMQHFNANFFVIYSTKVVRTGTNADLLTELIGAKSFFKGGFSWIVDQNRLEV